eukprot:TRINITY_DN9726_c0_g1_i1.p1 TRINITY_DN9726_c0_g1~~TRINITY_DN9726_c0_g1_i1.p1  ORF type:complete len:526 (+),score=153.84 TRINITY_DN9726_c0_g1_i1:16-1593(+)
MPVELMLLFAFKPEMHPFRLMELQSCARLFGTEVRVVRELGHEGCLVDVEFESVEAAKKVCGRMVLLRGVFEKWGAGKGYEELVAELTGCDRVVEYRNASFKFVFEAFGAKVTFEEKVEKFNKFASIGLEGEVTMSDPDHLYWIIEDRGLPTTNKKESNPLQKVYFARQVALSDRKSIDTYSLKTRKWIGTTTMIPELCMMMANHACVRKGSLVWDPFCGTGSTLVSAAHYGATCFGSDLDGRALGTKALGIQSNCQQYGFQPMEILRLDVSQACWNPSKSEIFEAIISDPPYGRRESRKKIDEEKSENIENFIKAMSPEEREKRRKLVAERYIPPPKVDYSMATLLTDLVDKAAKLLTVGGRLVYWHPTNIHYTQDELPTNPCLTLVSDDVQSVSIKLKRHLITMEKTRLWTAADVTTPPKSGGKEPDSEEEDTKEYLEYKAKRDKKRDCSKRFRDENNIVLPPKMTKSERRKLQEEQSAKKKAKRAEAEKLSFLKNKERSEKLKRAKEEADEAADEGDTKMEE